MSDSVGCLRVPALLIHDEHIRRRFVHEQPEFRRVQHGETESAAVNVMEGGSNEKEMTVDDERCKIAGQQ
jgi:hypothetical protein